MKHPIEILFHFPVPYSIVLTKDIEDIFEQTFIKYKSTRFF